MDKHVNIGWLQGRAWRAAARGHEVIADSTHESGGEDLGMTPGELMVTAMGMCVAIDLSYYAERHPGIDLSQVSIDLNWEDAPDKPSRIGMIRGTITLPGGLSEAERAALARVAGSCKIRRTLEQGVDVQVAIAWRDPAPSLS
jgi:putative redox protein